MKKEAITAMFRKKQGNLRAQVHEFENADTQRLDEADEPGAAAPGPRSKSDCGQPNQWLSLRTTQAANTHGNGNMQRILQEQAYEKKVGTQ